MRLETIDRWTPGNCTVLVQGLKIYLAIQVLISLVSVKNGG